MIEYVVFGNKHSRDWVLEDARMGGTKMRTVTKPGLTLFVDRTSQQWIVRDLEGHFWSFPSTDNPWDERQPFTPAE